MHVLRLLRIFIPLLILAAIVAGSVLVVSSRADLQRSRKQVDDTWLPLRGALATRYGALSAADTSVQSVPGPLHQLATQVSVAYNHWHDLVVHSGSSVTSEVNAANDLESLGRRLVIAARAAPRLTGNPAALVKVNAFAALVQPVSAAPFDAAVAHFERERNRPSRRLAAKILGYTPIPAYDSSAAG
jgi:hypothetical protein